MQFGTNSGSLKSGELFYAAGFALRSKSAIKNGPPTKLVMTPTGSSAGITITRAIQSANTSAMAPAIHDRGSSAQGDRIDLDA